MGRGGTFPDWYARRIRRIYPAVLMWALWACTLFGSHATILHTVLHGGGWFVSAIMIYYILLYIIRRHLQQHLTAVAIISTTAAFSLYWIVGNDDPAIYDTGSPFLVTQFFLSMLFGAIIGRNAHTHTTPRLRGALLGLLASIIAHAALSRTITWTAGTLHQDADMRFLLTLPRLAFIYYLYRLFATPTFRQLYTHPAFRRPVYTISALCLEIYLCQYALINTFQPLPYPANILAVTLLIPILAYAVHVTANLFSQTFGTNGYDLRAILRL